MPHVPRLDQSFYILKMILLLDREQKFLKMILLLDRVRNCNFEPHVAELAAAGQFVFYFPKGSYSCLPSPPAADSWPFKCASGGACTYAKPVEHVQRLHLLGRPVFGLVGAKVGWECSPTTLVA